MTWRHLFDCPVPTRGGMCSEPCQEAQEYAAEDADRAAGLSASSRMAAADERHLAREAQQREAEEGQP